MKNNLDDRSWLDGAVRVSTVVVDACVRIVPNFYFGPENDFTTAQWTDLREPIGVPLPSQDEWMPVELGLAHLDALVDHHRRLFEIARRHRRPIGPGSHEVWMTPRVIGDGRISPAFAWVDTYEGTDAVLSSLCADRAGVLLSDLDQGWEFLAVRAGREVILGERDWENDDDPGRVIAVDRELLVGAATAARARADDLLHRLTETLGEDPWAFRTRHRAR